MGVSTRKDGCRSLTEISNYAHSAGTAAAGGDAARKPDGAFRENVFGTYVHGVFDREQVAKAVVTALGRRKGIDVSGITSVDFAAFKEQQYDILAATLREHLNMEKIYEILNTGIEGPSATGKEMAE